ARANQLARHLMSHGVGPEVAVPILMHRSIDMVVAVLGILKAGGAYVPLDAATPSSRLLAILDDLKAKVMLTQQHFVRSLSGFAGPSISLDTGWAKIAGMSVAIPEASPEANPEARACGENLAYVMYTSGSTGKPKGVMIEHGSLSNYVRWASEHYRV